MLAWNYAARVLLFPDRATFAFLADFVATNPVSVGAAAAALLPELSTEADGKTFIMAGIAFGHFYLDRYDEGRLTAKENMQLFPHHMPFGAYIANCVGAGDLAEARSAAAAFLKFDPNFRGSRGPEIFPWRP